MNENLYFSTGGIKGKTPSQSIEYLNSLGVQNIELSAGIYEDNLLEKLKGLKKKLNLKLRIHNYFPPPEKPFVVNLASPNSEIRQQSFEFIKTAITFSSELEDDTYAFHAGFLIDPKVSDLGKPISKQNVSQREESKKLFIENVSKLADFAGQHGVKLLIENNVLSLPNFQTYQGNPFLMVETEEITEIIQALDGKAKLLLDVAHFKVSSHSLSFDYNKVNDLISLCGGFHLSDNDGTADSNQPNQENSWFWEYLSLDKYTCIESYSYGKDSIDQQIDLCHKHFKV